MTKNIRQTDFFSKIILCMLYSHFFNDSDLKTENFELKPLNCKVFEPNHEDICF